MPELPEVETVVREIRPRIVGQRIVRVRTEIARQVVGLTPRTFARRLSGQCIRAVTRRGKYIVIALEHGTLLIHLRMSGQLYVRSVKTAGHAHERAWFELEGERTYLVFRDVRTLGTLHYFGEQDEVTPLARMGWEPLEQSVTAKEFRTALAARASAIKPVLLDQSLWAGIGNIYASEALWEARIDPRKPANTLTLSQCAALIKAIVLVLDRALAKGGSTLKDFMSPDGKRGEYSGEFRVYGREGELCLRCGTKIKRFVQAQRSTYYCGRCQKS